MFWNRIKFTTKQINPWHSYITDEKPVYRPYWGEQELITEEDYIKLQRTLNLILDHLNLEYVPETAKKEPAKLVEKVKKPDFTIFGMPGFIDSAGLVSGSGDTTLTSTPKKKKRKYIKSGKYSKKK